MADLREKITITSSEWILIEIDPDTNGYVEMEISQINTNHSETQWSPINTETSTTAVLTKDTPKFDKDIYVRNANATALNPVYLAITRDSKFDSVIIANESIKAQGLGAGGVQSLTFPFGEQLVGFKQDDISVQFQYNYLDTQFSVKTSTTGVGASVGVQDSVAYAETLAPGETSYICSKDSIRYVSGHSGYAIFTLGGDVTDGGYVHGGGFNPNMSNGFIITIDSVGSGLHFGFLKNGVQKGSNYENGLDEVVNHGLALLNLNIYMIMFGYLGVANPMLFVKVNGLWKLLHMVDTEGKTTETHTSTPVFPICIMSHDGAKAITASWNGGIIGNTQLIGLRPFHFPIQLLGADPLEGTATTVGTAVKTIVAFKSLDLFHGKSNNVKARLTRYTINVYVPAGNVYGEVVFQLIKYSNFTGTPNWVNINSDSSVIQYDHTSGIGSAIVPTSGAVIDQGLVSYTGSLKGATVTRAILEAEKIGAYAYAGDTFAIIAKDRGGNGVTVSVSFNWEELF